MPSILVMLSLAATFASLVLEFVLPRFGMGRFGKVLAGAALYGVPVWLWTVTVALAYAKRSANPARPRTMRRILPVAFNGLRFFPMIVFFGAGLPFFYAAALALMVNTTDVLVSLSASDARWRPTRDRVLAMAIAFALEGAFVLHFMRESFAAGLATAAGSAAMLSLLMLAGLAAADPGTNYRKCVSSAAVALVLAAYFSLVGGSYRGGGYSVPAAKGVPAGGTPPAPESAESMPTAIGDGGFYGVILWPELEKRTKLVAPLPVWQGASQGALASPLSIPFSGEYWMYRLPYRQPPRNSYRRRGSPAKLFFHTTHGDPLMMEAKQKLDLPIALSCCSRIRLALRGSDPHPGSILLELILIDSTSAPARVLSLGKNMIAAEEIDFEIPPSPAIRQFNELQVVFHRDRINRSRSAHLAIDRFVLVPKGI